MRVEEMRQEILRRGLTNLSLSALRALRRPELEYILRRPAALAPKGSGVDTVDSERFFGTLRDAVNLVRASEVALSESRPGTAENYKAVIDRRRNRDALSSLLAQNPEEFAGLVLALARQVHDLQVENRTHARMDDRLAKVEAAMFDSQDNIDSPLGYLASSVEALEDRVNG